MRTSLYRARQFWQALINRPSEDQLRHAQAALSPAAFTLFKTMQPSEQLHSIQVLNRLLEQGHRHPDLLAAALLHDVGKSRLPLRIWERVFVVLAHAFFPKQAHAWGLHPAEEAGWRKALIVSRYHAAWGAEMATQAGSSPRTVYLIRRHQDDLAPPPGGEEEDILLALLQAADDKY